MLGLGHGLAKRLRVLFRVRLGCWLAVASQEGGDGGGPSLAALLGGGKIEVIPKNLERKKVS